MTLCINRKLSMSFVLKKLLSAILLPLPISLLLLLIGVLLLILSRLYKVGILFIFLGFFVLLIFSYSYIPNFLLYQLESRYNPLLQIPHNVNTIVVLGGGVGGNTQYPANTRLNSASLSRLIEGVRLYRQLQHKGIHAQLFLSGGRVFRSSSETGKMKNTAVILGVPPKYIKIKNGSIDTRHEAIYLQQWLKNRSFILVTSAAHMPRAMKLFRKLDMHPIPAPTQYLTRPTNNPFKSYFPNTINLNHADIAIHEYLGMTWAKWNGDL